MTAYVVSYLLSRVLLGVRGGGSLRRVEVYNYVRWWYALRAKTEHRWLRQSRLAQLGQEEVSW
jgi:hypothetical protein